MLSAPGTLLGIDTSTSACSIAVCDGGVILAHLHESMTRGQSERLAPMVEAGIAMAGIGFPDLDFVAVTRGPGSFTGLRVGLAFAKGLGQALDIPVFGVTGFVAVARAALAGADTANLGVAVVLESRRSDLFLQIFYRRWGALTARPLRCLPRASRPNSCRVILSHCCLLAMRRTRCRRCLINAGRQCPTAPPPRQMHDRFP